ncbi:MAG TPA: hypothetical protein VJN43_11710 [Bryobacteraceae bacterium]|nr:hypothetical protein [Bryobacteraceae bacterium]
MARNNLADVVTRAVWLGAELQGVRASLTSPTAAVLDECRARMEAVAHELAQLREAVPRQTGKQNAALRPPLESLRAEIHQVARLLDSAEAFHVGWIRQAASLAGGYTAAGIPAPTEAGRRLWTEV